MTPRTTLSAPATRRRVRLARLTATTLALLGFAANAHALSSNWLDYTAIAGSRLDIGSNIAVAGNYAVLRQGGTLTLGTNLYHDSVPADSFLAADAMEFITGASANNVFVNSLQLNGTAEVRGTKTTPLALPLNINVPALPANATSPCAQSGVDVTVAGGKTQSLPAGCYRNLIVSANATLNLTGGTYVFRQILVEQDGSLNAQSAATITVQQKLTTSLRSFFAPNSGNAADLMVFVAGTQNQIGNESTFIGRIVAPNDPGFEFGVRATFIGNAYAEGMNIFGVHLLRTPTPTPTRTPVVTPSPSPTPSPTPTSTVTPTPTPTSTGIPTPTPTQPFVPPTPTPTPTPTKTPSLTPTPGEPTPEQCPSAFSPNDCG
jgi:cell division septation protein DedD